MPQSLTKLYVHIVFGTKHREPIIDKNIESELHNYLGGIVKVLDCVPIKIGGYFDHIHILCRLSKKITIIKLLEEIKASSSKWAKTKGNKYSNFYWQDGYGAFTVSPYEVGKISRYIENQHEHHRKKTFKEEYLEFLKKNEAEYDERYLWD
jgi:REP element-mobilizing transposase RayT